MIVVIRCPNCNFGMLVEHDSVLVLCYKCGEYITNNKKGGKEKVSIYNKWIKGELTQEDVKQWLINQGEVKLLSIHGDGFTQINEIDHVAMCLHHIYLWHMKEATLGHFLTGVLKNDFNEACGRADSTNTKVLSIYTKFLYNCAPMSYKVKAKEEL